MKLLRRSTAGLPTAATFVLGTTTQSTSSAGGGVSAWSQVVASVSTRCRVVGVSAFDSVTGHEAMVEFGVGAAGSEVWIGVCPQGEAPPFPILLEVGQRLAVRHRQTPASGGTVLTVGSVYAQAR